MRPSARRHRESGSNRILGNVTRRDQQILIRTERVVVEARLPQSFTRAAPLVEASALLESLDEPDEIRVLGVAEDKRVDVVRHDHVGKGIEACH